MIIYREVLKIIINAIEKKTVINVYCRKVHWLIIKLIFMYHILKC